MPVTYKQNDYWVARQITRLWEGGGYDALNTYDSGVLSYGILQWTYASGNLAALLDVYRAMPNNSPAYHVINAHELYAGSANDSRFLAALRAAAREPQMIRAQEDRLAAYFDRYYLYTAQPRNFKTPLGIAFGFDCAVNHGFGHPLFYDAENALGLENKKPLASEDVERALILTAALERVRLYKHLWEENPRAYAGLEKRYRWWIEQVVKGNWELAQDTFVKGQKIERDQPLILPEFPEPVPLPDPTHPNIPRGIPFPDLPPSDNPPVPLPNPLNPPPKPQTKPTGSYINLDMRNPLGKPEPEQIAAFAGIRLPLNNDQNQPFSVYREQIKRYVDSGLRVLFVITHQTFSHEFLARWWHVLIDREHPEYPNLIQDMARELGQIVHEWAWVGADWQIWNEPDNLATHASIKLTATNYGLMLAQFATVIHQHQSQARIVSAGFNSGPDTGAAFALSAYRTAKQNGLSAPLDIAFHPYGRGVGAGRYNQFGEISESIQKYMRVVRYTGGQLVVSEFGVLDRPNDSPKDVAAYAKQMVTAFRNGGVSIFAWYAWRDGMDNGYGVATQAIGQVREDIVLALTLIPVVIVTPGKNGTTATVQAAALRLRSQASIHSHTLAHALRNERVELVNMNLTIADGYEWLRVRYRGLTGYMAMREHPAATCTCG